jgi:hypothetical protein
MTDRSVILLADAGRLITLAYANALDVLLLPGWSVQMPRKANLGELAVQEVMTDFALIQEPPTGIFLFEDHKIARASFLLPEHCHKISTRAFLQFLEQKGLVESAAEIERRAVQAGRAFSQLRFPPV